MSARVASSTNVNTAFPPASIDGVTLNVGDRVLLVGQTNPVHNGIYVLTNEFFLQKADDWSIPSYQTPGTLVYVREGTTYGKTLWVYNGSNVFQIFSPTKIQGSSGPTYSDVRVLQFTNGTVTSLGNGKYGVSIMASFPQVGSSFTAYVDTVDGNDSTGTLADIKRPFQTLNGLLDYLSSNDLTINGGNSYSITVFVSSDPSFVHILDFPGHYSGSLLYHLDIQVQSPYQTLSIVFRGTEYTSVTLTHSFTDFVLPGSITILQLDSPQVTDRYVIFKNIDSYTVSVGGNVVNSTLFFNNLVFVDCKNISVSVTGLFSNLDYRVFRFLGCSGCSCTRSVGNAFQYDDTIYVENSVDTSLFLAYKKDPSNTLQQNVQVYVNNSSNTGIHNLNLTTAADILSGLWLPINLSVDNSTLTTTGIVYGDVTLKHSYMSAITLCGFLRSIQFQDGSLHNITSTIFYPNFFLCANTEFLFSGGSSFSAMFLLDGLSPTITHSRFQQLSVDPVFFYVGAGTLNLLGNVLNSSSAYNTNNPVLDNIIFTNQQSDLTPYVSNVPNIGFSGTWKVPYYKETYVDVITWQYIQSQNLKLFEGNKLYYVDQSSKRTGIHKKGVAEGSTLQNLPIFIDDYDVFRGIRSSMYSEFIYWDTFNKMISTLSFGQDLSPKLDGDFTLYSLMFLPIPINLTSLRIQITNFVTAGSVVVALYRVDENTLDGSLYFDTTINVTGSGTITETLHTPVTLDSGAYYVMISSNGGSTGQFTVLIANNGLYKGVFYNNTSQRVNSSLKASYTSTPSSIISVPNQLISIRPYVELYYQDVL
ncbi:MAG: hypothetical protein QXE78_01880 [Nitrososphaeria archaeon]